MSSLWKTLRSVALQWHAPIDANTGVLAIGGECAATGKGRSPVAVREGHHTSVRGVWLYLSLVIDVWSHKVVAWDVAEREDAQMAADLVSRACLRERISKGRPRHLILHADNGNAMRAAMLESRLEELIGLVFLERPHR